MTDDPRFIDKSEPTPKPPSCYACKFYARGEFRDWEYCHKAQRDVVLRIGQHIAEWCPLPNGENHNQRSQ
ncbi:MAG: hypothetical protein ABFD89_13200 [Bryobacteraceae bacterium]